jgi:hypothetical protein
MKHLRKFNEKSIESSMDSLSRIYKILESKTDEIYEIIKEDIKKQAGDMWSAQERLDGFIEQISSLLMERFDNDVDFKDESNPWNNNFKKEDSEDSEITEGRTEK